MRSEADRQIQAVAEKPIQAFYTNRFQLYDLMEVLLKQLEAVYNLYITSFSISEEFIRKMGRFKQQYRIQRILLLLDRKAAIKISRLLPFAKNVFEEVYLTDNHGKVVLFDSQPQISVCTSQNQTRGNRREATLVTADPECYQVFYDEIQQMIQTGIQL